MLLCKQMLSARTSSAFAFCECSLNGPVGQGHAHEAVYWSLCCEGICISDCDCDCQYSWQTRSRSLAWMACKENPKMAILVNIFTKLHDFLQFAPKINYYVLYMKNIFKNHNVQVQSQWEEHACMISGDENPNICMPSTLPGGCRVGSFPFPSLCCLAIS